MPDLTAPPTTVRTVELIDVPVPVTITHCHLTPADRVEDSALSMERLLFSATVQLSGPTWLPEGRDGFRCVFNYAAIHARLSEMGDLLLREPLEGLLDRVLRAIEEEAESLKSNNVRLLGAHVRVIRRGLIDGEIRASVRRTY